MRAILDWAIRLLVRQYEALDDDSPVQSKKTKGTLAARSTPSQVH